MTAWILHDDAADLHATWLPGAGMLGASLVHHGEELLWQGAGAGEYAQRRAFMGVPFLHPWANRLDHFGYRTGGHDVVLDPASPLLLLDDTKLPIHGLLNATPRWTVHETAADRDAARLVAVLEFDDDDLLAAFPFPHRVEMTIRLGSGALEVRVVLSTTGDRAVPVSFGFHPYLQLPGLPRAEWQVVLPVRRMLLLDDRMLPTGEKRTVAPITGPIGDRTLDDCFDRLGTPARFTVSGAGRELAIEFVEGYSTAQIFAPPGEQYICVEPMTAPVNSLSGPDSGLAWVLPGRCHSACFRIVVKSIGLVSAIAAR